VILDASQLQLDETQVTAAINSFKNILTWTGNVMKAFEFMQWVPIGQVDNLTDIRRINVQYII